MTGHYLEGLIFACVAIYGFVRAIRGDGRHWFVLGVLGYILACTCKEIYVPIPVLLLALPEGDWKKRFRFIAPFLVVTFLYLCWRFTVLGNIIGGYRDRDDYVEFSIGIILLQYAKLPTLLFRHNLLGYLALIALAMPLFVKHLSPRLVAGDCRRQRGIATPCSADDIARYSGPRPLLIRGSGGQSRLEAPSCEQGQRQISWSIPSYCSGVTHRCGGNPGWPR